MPRASDHPLQLETHLMLRRKLSTVQRSSVMDVWREAHSGHKLETVYRFLKSRFGTGMLSSGEFIQFGFCSPGVPLENIDRFAGKRAQQAFNKIYNDQTWYAVTKNKLLFETLMKGAGQPVPETIAIFDRKGRGAGSTLLRSRADLEAFLLNPSNHPVFCKPTTGLLSIGSFRIDDVVDGKLLVNGTHKYTVEEVCDYIQGISLKGYLFQKVLNPDSKFKKIGIDEISSLRFVVLNNESNAALHSAVLKLPASGEVADNFWRKGSVIASINTDDGSVERAVLKTEEDAVLLERSKEKQSEILDFKIPRFSEAKRVVLEAARFLPAVRVQSWDVAITDKGPVLLEVNFGGDLNLYQLSSGKGVMSPDFCAILKDAGYTGYLPR